MSDRDVLYCKFFERSKANVVSSQLASNINHTSTQNGHIVNSYDIYQVFILPVITMETVGLKGISFVFHTHGHFCCGNSIVILRFTKITTWGGLAGTKV